MREYDFVALKKEEKTHLVTKLNLFEISFLASVRFMTALLLIPI
jgi:hypothetical protein